MRIEKLKQLSLEEGISGVDVFLKKILTSLLKQKLIV